MPYPFQHNVDLAEEPDVVVQILIDMPIPHNLSVHLANEHRMEPPSGSEEAAVRHLMLHLYGDFRPGAEHYHVKGEYA